MIVGILKMLELFVTVSDRHSHDSARRIMLNANCSSNNFSFLASYFFTIIINALFRLSQPYRIIEYNDQLFCRLFWV